MSMFDLHATVLQDYKDFVQKFSTMADDRARGTLRIRDRGADPSNVCRSSMRMPGPAVKSCSSHHASPCARTMASSAPPTEVGPVLTENNRLPWVVRMPSPLASRGWSCNADATALSATSRLASSSVNEAESKLRTFFGSAQASKRRHDDHAVGIDPTDSADRGPSTLPTPPLRSSRQD